MEEIFDLSYVAMEDADVLAAIRAMERRFSATLVALQWECHMEPGFSERLITLQWEFHIEIQNLLQTLGNEMLSAGCASTETIHVPTT